MGLPTVSPINQLLAAGPDKYSNQFSVLILRKDRENINSEKGTSSEPNWNSAWLFSDDSFTITSKATEDAAEDSEDSDSEKTANLPPFEIKKNQILTNTPNCADFKVRVLDIEIPLPKNTNFQTQFFNTQVERSSTKLTFTNRSALNLELDNSLLYLDAFQNLAGHYNADKDKLYYDNQNKKYIYNIYVISNPLKQGEATIINDGAPITYWEFYDCRFLGNENEIKFSNSVNTVTATFPFIFYDLRMKFGG